MSFKSVDALQRTLARDVFYYAKDAKKAAGRALGSLVEIITFYLLKSWGCERHMVIEKRLSEYNNPEIVHNVEFSLHPSYRIATVRLDRTNLPLTPRKIAKLMKNVDWSKSDMKSTQLLTSDEVLRNACVLYEDEHRIITAYLGKTGRQWHEVSVFELTPHPFAVVECKRVGVEEGARKGPQTIEKAKQGAYVARTISSLQRIRMSDGSIFGILHKDNGELCWEPYQKFLQKVVASSDPKLLRDFTLTVGVVSNHGNWFTSDDHNKELKVLAQSYDWLLFLTDSGFSHFIEAVLMNPGAAHNPIKKAFADSYSGKKGANRFTKVRVALAADKALQEFFSKNLSSVEQWFNVISPVGHSIAQLRGDLSLLASKNWKEILG